MRVTIQFPEEIAEQVLALPDRDAFVSDVVARALMESPSQRPAREEESSRWARLVQRVESDSEQLGDAYTSFRQAMREFREEFDLPRGDAQ